MLSDPASLLSFTYRLCLVATDSIVKFLKYLREYDAILTWLNHLSRRAGFTVWKDMDKATFVGCSFSATTFLHRRLPDVIILDRDHKFTSQFRTEFMKICSFKLRMSSTQQSQTDGTFKVMNIMVRHNRAS